MEDQLKAFEGTWKYDRSENFDEFLKDMGVGMIKRQTAKALSPTLVITVDKDKITINTSAGPMTKKDEITLGQEFETDVQGEKGKVIVTLEDGKLCGNPSPNNTNPKIPKTKRSVVNGEMCMELDTGKVVAKRIFKKQ